MRAWLFAIAIPANKKADPQVGFFDSRNRIISIQQVLQELR
jgi:hypothetical protein